MLFNGWRLVLLRRKGWTGCAIVSVAVLLVYLLSKEPQDNGPTRDLGYTELLDLPPEDDWHPISEDIFVYSAFYDAINEPGVVRVIAAVTTIHQKVDCFLTYTRRSRVPYVKRVLGFIANINESHDTKFTAAYILCYTTISAIPQTVALVSSDEHNSTLQPIPVHQITNRNYTIRYLVCVPPLHSTIDINHLVTWVEFNRILGVEMFLIYNFDAPEEALAILRYYQSRGILRILPWSLRNSNIRPRINGSMHNFGQLAAINDCLYRSKMESEYVASFDLDEFIVPQGASHLTFDHMFRFRPDFDIFEFRNVFFVPENTTLSKDSSPYVIHRTQRCRNIHVHRDRSKYIAKSAVLVTMGIHEVWAARSTKVDAVSSTSGLLHHYRSHLPVPCDRIMSSNVVNKYKDVLRENVNRTLTSMASVR